MKKTDSPTPSQSAAPPATDTPFGARVRALLDGATNEEIAERLGLSLYVVKKALTTSQVSTRALTRIVAATGRDAGWLRSGEKAEAHTEAQIRLNPALSAGRHRALEQQIGLLFPEEEQ